MFDGSDEGFKGAEDLTRRRPQIRPRERTSSSSSSCKICRLLLVDRKPAATGEFLSADEFFFLFFCNKLVTPRGPGRLVGRVAWFPVSWFSSFFFVDVQRGRSQKWPLIFLPVCFQSALQRFFFLFFFFGILVSCVFVVVFFLDDLWGFAAQTGNRLHERRRLFGLVECESQRFLSFFTLYSFYFSDRTDDEETREQRERKVFKSVTPFLPSSLLVPRSSSVQ